MCVVEFEPDFERAGSLADKATRSEEPELSQPRVPDVFGFNGGAGGAINYDDEMVTAAGLAAGFNNYVPLGSWGHQGYRTSTFSGLGFTSLIDAPVYGTGVSGLLSKPTTGVPVPGTLLLMSVGLLAVGALRRRA